MSGRRRKYCDKTCSNRAAEANRRPVTTTCSQPVCERPTRARMLCSTHYNQTLPNRHKTRITTCVVCGANVARAGGGGRKYGATCSLECRRRLTWSEHSELPADHWGRWYGATSALYTGECDWCGQVYATRYLTSKVCSNRCRRARRSQRRTAREHGAEGEYRWTQVVALWASIGQRCTYCRDHLPLTEMQVEHVTPLSRGGRNDMTNIVPSCGACNAEKSDRTPEEWDADRHSREQTPRSTYITTHPQLHHLVRLTPAGAPYRLRPVA